MKKNNLLALLILVASISIFLASNQYYALRSTQVFTFPASLEVSNGTIGIDKTTELLQFSLVPPTGIGKRFLTLHPLDVDVRLAVSAKGSLAPWLSSPDNGIIIPKNTTQKITIVASVPANATVGELLTAEVIISLIPSS